MDIRLVPMSMAQCKAFFREFEHDPAVFTPEQPFVAYRYNQAEAEAYWKKNQAADRCHLAIMHGGEVIGELIFKNINQADKSCTLSIHMKNDSVKNRGFGTEAERLSLRYARDILQMHTVYADTLIRNTRSQHVLEKNGFQMTGQNRTFRYYKRIL